MTETTAYLASSTGMSAPLSADCCRTALNSPAPPSPVQSVHVLLYGMAPDDFVAGD